MKAANKGFVIKTGTIEQAFELYLKIPEFKNPYKIEVLQKRFIAKHLILVAYHKDAPVAFKIGYALNEDVFYSWLGGVLPKYRNLKIASQLIIEQENWAKLQHFSSIEVKTRNCFKGMLKLLIAHDYLIKSVEPKSSTIENRIIFSKKL